MFTKSNPQTRHLLPSDYAPAAVITGGAMFRSSCSAGFISDQSNTPHLKLAGEHLTAAAEVRWTRGRATTIISGGKGGLWRSFASN
ncbi:hypothetical protein HanPI659440_Chr15g0592771 [Helianthus annuus]|nr:hypothetical protein HanPI659440_Chr15g0592771 [Helianthus annuus]